MIGPAAFFGYWSDDDHDHEVHPDPPPKDAARPFVVQAHGDHWIPISILVFAIDEDHAKQRVLTALHEVARLDYKRDEWSHSGPGERATKLLEQLDSGKLALEVEPYDTDLIAAEVIWADNGGF